MIEKYSVFTPGKRGSFTEEWQQCLKQIIRSRKSDSRLIKLNVFADLPDYDTYIRESRGIAKNIHDAFDKYCPAYNITVHPPEKPFKVAVEAGYIVPESAEINCKIWRSLPYVVIKTATEKEVWMGGLGSGLFHEDTRNAAIAAFDQMRSRFSSLASWWTLNILKT